VTVLLFTLVATWNNYFLPLIMLSNPDFYPITRRAPALLAVGPAAESAKQ
jgi:ABC-type glycerol-3-phosphate transport system permease component